MNLTIHTYLQYEAFSYQTSCFPSKHSWLVSLVLLAIFHDSFNPLHSFILFPGVAIMKFPHILVVCLASFLSVSLAIPVGSDDGQGPPKERDKGKGKAPPPSRPGTPTPADDPNVPLPGRNGWYTDPRTGVTTMYYGDDTMPEHMRHTDRNQQRFPENAKPKELASDQPVDPKNRNNALHNVPKAPPHPVTGRPRVKDEKLPNMFHNPNHDKTTTVEYRDEEESSGKDPKGKKAEEAKAKSKPADRPWNAGPSGLSKCMFFGHRGSTWIASIHTD